MSYSTWTFRKRLRLLRPQSCLPWPGRRLRASNTRPRKRKGAVECGAGDASSSSSSSSSSSNTRKRVKKRGAAPSRLPSRIRLQRPGHPSSHEICLHARAPVGIVAEAAFCVLLFAFCSSLLPPAMHWAREKERGRVVEAERVIVTIMPTMPCNSLPSFFPPPSPSLYQTCAHVCIDFHIT